MKRCKIKIKTRKCINETVTINSNSCGTWLRCVKIQGNMQGHLGHVYTALNEDNEHNVLEAEQKQHNNEIQTHTYNTNEMKDKYGRSENINNERIMYTERTRNKTDTSINTKYSVPIDSRKGKLTDFYFRVLRI